MNTVQFQSADLHVYGERERAETRKKVSKNWVQGFHPVSFPMVGTGLREEKQMVILKPNPSRLENVILKIL